MALKTRNTRHTGTSGWEQALFIIVLLVSLAMRLGDIGLFLTEEEPLWLDRAGVFLTGITDGDLVDGTPIDGASGPHSGVISLWLGAAAIELDQFITTFDLEWEPAQALQTDARAPVPPGLFYLRHIIALITWLAGLAMFYLLRPVFGRRGAGLTTLLLVLNPLYLFYGRLYGIEALLASLVMLCLGGVLVYLCDAYRPWSILLAAVVAALATVQSLVGLWLLLWMLIVLAIAAFREEQILRSRIWHMAFGVGIYLAVMLLTWPALRIAPVQTLTDIMSYSGELTERGVYFFGAVRADPGPAFYPVVWLYRASPWAILGGISLLVFKRQRHDREWLIGPPALLALGWLLLITVLPGKAEGVLLPLLLITEMLGALGLILSADAVEARIQGPLHVGWISLVIVMLVVHSALIWPTRPYYSTYFNPLIGGARTVRYALPLGRGEGLEGAAAYLNALPDSEDHRVAIQGMETFWPLFAGEIESTEQTLTPDPNYYVLYISQVQRSETPELTEPLLMLEEPLHVVQSGGLTLVWVYDNPLR